MFSSKIVFPKILWTFFSCKKLELLVFCLWVSGLELKKKSEDKKTRILTSASLLREDFALQTTTLGFPPPWSKTFFKIQRNRHRRRQNDDSPDGLVVVGLDSPRSFSTCIGRPGWVYFCGPACMSTARPETYYRVPTGPGILEKSWNSEFVMKVLESPGI